MLKAQLAEVSYAFGKGVRFHFAVSSIDSENVCKEKKRIMIRHSKSIKLRRKLSALRNQMNSNTPKTQTSPTPSSLKI